MLIRRKPLFYVACCGVLVGLALLIFPPYSAYCESEYANNYYCTAYSVASALSTFVDTHNGAFTALATIAIAWFTLTLKRSTDRLWDATNRSVDALISAENCYLFPIIVTENVGKLISTYGRYDKSESMWKQEVETPSIALYFQNFGRTSHAQTDQQ
jgi:hypothetical protein